MGARVVLESHHRRYLEINFAFHNVRLVKMIVIEQAVGCKLNAPFILKNNPLFSKGPLQNNLLPSICLLYLWSNFLFLFLLGGVTWGDELVLWTVLFSKALGRWLCVQLRGLARAMRDRTGVIEHGLDIRAGWSCERAGTVERRLREATRTGLSFQRPAWRSHRWIIRHLACENTVPLDVREEFVLHDLFYVVMPETLLGVFN